LKYFLIEKYIKIIFFLKKIFILNINVSKFNVFSNKKHFIQQFITQKQTLSDISYAHSNQKKSKTVTGENTNRCLTQGLFGGNPPNCPLHFSNLSRQIVLKYPILNSIFSPIITNPPRERGHHGRAACMCESANVYFQ